MTALCERCERPVDRDGLCFRHRVATVRFGGLIALKAQREAGLTEREIARENVERFEKERGYPPVREDGKDRWI